MAAGVIVGGAVGVATLYLWGWRRFKYMRAYWRNNKQNIEFERRLREAREDASAERTYRVATAADDELVGMLEIAKADEAELVACGFTVLGDVAVSTADRPRAAYLRTFVDRSQTTSATLAIFGIDRKRWLWFASYRDDEAFVTMRGPMTRFAEPPNVHRQALARDLPSAKAADQHRSFAHAGDATKPCLPLRTVDELLAQVQTFQTLTLRWREAQAPDVLLDADLHHVLGEHYERLGKVWARRLRSNLPAATLRRS